MRFVQVGGAVVVALCMGSATFAANVGAGNLVVFHAGDGTTLANNAPFSIIELNRTAGQAAPVQSFGISAMGVDPLWASASATSTGYMSLNEARTAVQFAGHTTRGTAPFPNINTITARGVGSLTGAGTYSLAGSYTGNSGNQARSGGLMNSGDLYISDQGGFYAPGGAAPALAANIRNTRSFGGTLFVMQQSTTATVVSSVGGTPAAPSITGLTGLGPVNTAQDFYMVSRAGNSVFDLMYLTTTAGINKYELVAGTWTARGSAAISGGFIGLAAEVNPTGGVSLFVTTGGGAGNGNSVRLYLDGSSLGSNITLDAGTTLYTAPANTTLKGIEILPAPGAAGLMALGGIVAARRRRK